MIDPRHGASDAWRVIDSTPPVAYLTTEPTAEEATLAEQVGTHIGAATPFWMLARVALQQHSIAVWAAARRRMERRLRGWVLAGASIAATNLVGVVVFLYHRQDAMAEQQRAAGADQERAAALAREVQRYRDTTEETIRELRLDIRELRASMRKLTGAEPAPNGSALPDSNAVPDKLSSLLLVDPAIPACLVPR